MAEGVLGLGSGQAASLNNDLIERLKEAERKSTVEPIESQIEEITKEGGESEKIAEIIAKSNELLEGIKPFDLYVSGGITAFEQKSATTSGTSVVFDAVDESSLNTGTTTVDITTLAKRDVFETLKFTDKDAMINGSDSADDTLVITHSGTDYTFETNGKTYQELADEINSNANVNATIEEVASGEYRIVIKSAELGLDNALTIQQNGTLDIWGVDGGQRQTALNMTATVDGVAYSSSSNTIVVDGGLKISAVEEGVSTINIEKDTSTVTSTLQSFANTYNELVALVDSELYSSDSPIEDKSTLRTMMESIKSQLFDAYGTDDSLSIFNYGFELAKDGSLSVNTEKLNDAVENNLDDLKSLFLGLAEDEGLGTKLKTYLDSLDGFDGLLTGYQENISARKSSLEEEKDKAIEALDNKYSLLAQQFASYGTIINQFESSFSGLKLMIQQSTAS